MMATNVSAGSHGIETDADGELLELFSFGFDRWLVQKSPAEVRDRLKAIDRDPIGRAQLNQLLHLCHEPGLSDGFFRYYWLSAAGDHPYDVEKIPGFDPSLLQGDLIQSIQHLRWGLYRMYVDALLFYGDVRIAFDKLRVFSESDLRRYFAAKRVDIQAMGRRGPAMRLVAIARDNRYLISEMACKSYGGDLKQFLRDVTTQYAAAGGGKTTIRNLLDKAFSNKNTDRQAEFFFSAEDILDEEIENAGQVEEKYERIFALFETSRKAALKNTDYFLSMVNDLDVYVATSMRDRDDFRRMADFCQRIFRVSSLKPLNLRYFDPTVSAADGHEDKGLIECLMVKSSKVLVYCAGKRDSFGKDAEAAMALSLGKPVIFFCDEAGRERFFNEVHPLSRLIQFETGIAVGAMVTSSENEVIELLRRIFWNEMEYELVQRPTGLRLIEKLTGSTVRLQTRNPLLRETFRNYYHNKV